MSKDEPRSRRRRLRWTFILGLLALIIVASTANLLIQYGRGDPLTPFEVALGIIVAMGATAAFATLLAIIAEHKLW